MTKNQNSNNKNEKSDYLRRKEEDFLNLGKTKNKRCPEPHHIVLSRFYELLDDYSNKHYVKVALKNMLNNDIKKKKTRINILQREIDFYNQLEADKIEDPEWKNKYNASDIKRAENINTITNTKEIEKLEDDIKYIKEWQKIPKEIPPNKSDEDNQIGNNDYLAIIKEFSNIYNGISNLVMPYLYNSTIEVPSFKNVDLLEGLAKELESKIGLCVESSTQEFYYNDGNGRFIPYTYDPILMSHIRQNTTFMKPNGANRQGTIINSKDLFEKLPQWISTSRTKNQDLVGFNNCFYNVPKGEIQHKEINIPLLPLRNTKTELYLDEKIDGGAMEHIFKECFTEEDREALLAYLGCCLYDKGYTQRQESIFLLSLGGLGKSTFVKALCEIFYSSGSQIVKKLSDEKFGLSMFADNDCIVVDEIQGANEDFVEILKTISTGGDLAVEKKNKDTINIPAEVVPRCWFVGNQFPKKVYESAGGEGVFRRILVITPKKSIVDLGYIWQDLITDECKQWLVQQATKTYVKLELDKKSKSIDVISPEEKMDRIEKCTYPEQYFIKKHFHITYDDVTGRPDERIDYVAVSDMHKFIYDEICDNMIEPTIRRDNDQTFIIELKKALGIESHMKAGRRDGRDVKLYGVEPTTEKANEYFDEIDGKGIL